MALTTVDIGTEVAKEPYTDVAQGLAQGSVDSDWDLMGYKAPTLKMYQIAFHLPTRPDELIEAHSHSINYDNTLLTLYKDSRAIAIFNLGYISYFKVVQ